MYNLVLERACVYTVLFWLKSWKSGINNIATINTQETPLHAHMLIELNMSLVMCALHGALV